MASCQFKSLGHCHTQSLSRDVKGLVGQEVYTKQQNKPTRNAENFLRKVDGEALFQLALLADAGDEEAVLLRLHDKDTIDIAGIPARLREFTQRLDFLSCVMVR